MARGEIAAHQFQWQRAIDHYRKALAVLEQRAGPNHPYATVIQTNLGHTLIDVNRFDEAAEVLARALQGMTALLGPDNPELIGPLSGFVAANLRRGRFAEAEATARRGLALVAGSPTTMYDWEVRLHHSLARALWGQQRLAEATAAIGEAQRVRRTVMARNIEALPEQRSLQYRDQLAFVDDVHVALVALQNDPAAVANLWQAQIEVRGLVTAAVAQRLAQLRGRADPDVKALYAQWRDARREANAASAETRIARERAVDRAEERLAERLTSGATARGERDTALAELVAALPPRSALVTFAVTRVADPLGEMQDRLEPTLHALIHESGRAGPRIVALGQGRELGAAIDAWVALLRDPDSALDAVRTQGAVVRQRLWQPLGLAADRELVFVVPEGGLHRVNLAALPDGDGWLAEHGPRFHVLEHERDLLQAAADRRPDSALLVAVSGPRAAAAGDRRALLACGNAALPALEGARREVEGIGALLRDAGYAQVTTLADAAAGERAVRAALAGDRIVHFATHGVAWDSTCAKGSQRLLALAPAGEGAPDARVAQGGLLLHPPATRNADEDGILSTDEVAIADLDATDLAVLSACDTGRGPLVGGEGVIGLARAFRLAGARRTLVSLWPVEDEATADFMAAFYGDYLQPGTPIDAALRAAQRALIAAPGAASRHAHPFYWAAFVTRGGWR
jgi:CHAT domain-containing protein